MENWTETIFSVNDDQSLHMFSSPLATLPLRANFEIEKDRGN